MSSPTFDYEAHFNRPAVRRGAIYCAPWCGANCTWAAFQEAARLAKALCKRLGPCWEPCVHENLGWHWKVVNGILEVRPWHDKGKTEYSAWCQSHPQVISDYFKTPEEALASLAEQINARVQEQVQALQLLLQAEKVVRS